MVDRTNTHTTHTRIFPICPLMLNAIAILCYDTRDSVRVCGGECYNKSRRICEYMWLQCGCMCGSMGRPGTALQIVVSTMCPMMWPAGVEVRR